jgi:predicted RNA binding protein YcfA (HicA-like mRNA interferase family)
LKADGWTVARVKGSHHHLTHPMKKGIVTVKHPAKDYPIQTLRSMEKQSGVSLR